MQAKTAGRTPWASGWLQGAGIGILLTLGLTWNQLSATHLDLYHKLLPINTVLRAIALTLAAACLLGALLIWALDRVDAAGRTLLWALLFAVLAARTVSGLMVAQVVQRQGVTPIAGFLAAGAALVLLWGLSRRGYAAAVRGLRMTLLLLGICIFWALPTLAVEGFAAEPRDLESFQRPVAHQPEPHRRIVWLLFDEMSYDQAFAHRWPGLEMPNFDRLRAESTAFSDIQPDGNYTEKVIPSLFLGRSISDARSTLGGELQFRSGAGRGWTNFDESATIFADARRREWTTGISGDYNPYCRLLRQQLDWCSMRLIVFGDHLSRDKSTWQNFTAPLRAGWARAAHESYEPAGSEAQYFAGIVANARSLIADDDIDFVFVHLYLPHPPGQYDRRSGMVRRGGSYIDNLALADRTLGELTASLAGTPSAGMTTLVVSSDHSWRVPLWRHETGWTREDEEASGHGRFEPRPVLIVHLPEQTAAQEITQPVPLLSMHDMLESMIAGEIDTPGQLQNWAARW